MNKKKLKIVILIFYVVICFFLAATINKKNLDEITLERFDIEHNFKEIYIPKNIIAKNKASVNLILKKISEELNINILIRETNYTTSKDKPIPKDFVLINYYINTPKKSSISDVFKIDTSELNYNEIISSSRYYHQSTKDILDENNPDIIFNLQKISSNTPLYESSYFIETKNKDTLDTFLDKLSLEINSNFKEEYNAANFEKQSIPEHLILTKYTSLIEYLIISLISLLLFIVIWIFSNTKTIAIFRMNGFSSIDITKVFYFKPLILLTLFSTLFNSAFVLKKIDFFYIFCQFLFMMIIFLVIYIGVYGLSKLNISLLLNQKKHTKWVFGAMLSVKILFIFYSISLFSIFANIILTPFYSLKIPENQKEYAVFYPRLVGRNYSDLLNNRYNDEDEKKLYKYLNDNNALLINTDQYKISNELTGNMIKVNPNYLLDNSIFDIKNNQIIFDESETRPIFILNEQLNLEENSIYTYLEKEGYINPILIWMQPNQNLETYDPTLLKVSNVPLIEVQTLNNYTFLNREIFTGTSFKEPLKINLTGKDEDSFLQEMKGILNSTYLDDNLQTLVKIENIQKEELVSTVQNFLKFTLEMVFIFIIAFEIIFFTIVFQFMDQKEKFVLLRIEGFSFIKTYKNIITIIILQYIPIFILMLFDSTPLSLKILVLILFLGIESLITILCLIKLEKSQKYNVIEGE